MRRLPGLVLAFAAACATPPPPMAAPAPEAPKPAEAPPFELSAFTVKQQTLLGFTLELKGKVAKPAGATPLAWKISALGNDLASGTASVTPDAEGSFAQELKVELGADAAALAPYQKADTFEMVLDARWGEGEAALASSRAVRVRAPKIPVIEIKSVQASRNGPADLGLTYLFNIGNPNPFEVRASTLRYTALLDGKSVATGELPLGAKVPASGENLFEIPGEATANTCGKDITAMLKRAELPWGFNGTLKIGGIEVPIDLRGNVPISQ